MKKLSLFMFMPFLLTACYEQPERENYPEHSYDEITSYKIMWDEVFSVSQNNHLVYYYSESCYYCEQLRNEVIDFAINEYFPIYFVEVNAHIEHTYDYTKISQTIGSNRPQDVYVGVTPQLALIENNKIEKNVLENIYIEELLDRYKPN